MSKYKHSSRSWFRAMCNGVVAAATLSLCNTVNAFAPGGYHFYPGSKTHVEITEEALQKVYDSAGLTTVTNSMKAARKEFTDADKGVDNDQYSSAKHFDGENFADGQARINDLLGKAVLEVQSDDFSEARKSVGQALHIVQDLYAHSNWVGCSSFKSTQKLIFP